MAYNLNWKRKWNKIWTANFVASRGIFNPLQIAGLKLWLDGSDFNTLTTAYQNLTSTVTGTSGLSALVCSGDESLNIFVSMTVRVNGTDIYTVQSVATSVGVTTITVVGTLSTNYVASALAVRKISQWDDKSGNGSNVTQGISTKQPIYSPSRLNSKDVIVFNGSATLIIPAGLYNIPTGNNAMFIVTQQASNTGNYGIIELLNTGGGALRYALDSTITAGQMQFISGTDATGALLGSTTKTNPNIYNAYRSNTTLSLQANNGIATTSSVGNNAAAGIGHIGSYSDLSAYLVGYIAEILIYSTDLTPTLRAQINAFLSNKWGIAIP